MTEKMKLFSPAKVNLFFRVLSKREDGYHNISSLYQTVDLKDVIHIKKGCKDCFWCNNSSLNWDETNLVFKALDFFRNKTKEYFPVEICLEKNIPILSGLGGGSSNAATTLYALWQLSKKNIPLSLLIEWAGEIGSDVAFFFSLGRAYCYERGNKFISIDFDNYNFSGWLAKPKFGLSTQAVYQSIKQVDTLEKVDPYVLLQSFERNMAIHHNDLEYWAIKICPKMKIIKENLLELGFKNVMMTGSGTTFICIGNVLSPSLKGVDFYHVKQCLRKQDSWYE